MEQSKWIRSMNKYKTSYLLIVTLILSSFATIMKAQEDLQVEEVKVIKDFEARLKDFRKINLEPVLPSFDISSRSYEYKVSSKALKLEYEKPSIRPLALPEEK